MIDRIVVERLLQACDQRTDIKVPAGPMLAELCRTWLAVEAAPVVDFWLGYDEYGITFDGDESEELAAAKSFNNALPRNKRVRLVVAGPHPGGGAG